MDILRLAARSALGPARAALGTADALRRAQGRLLDHTGLAPQPTPSRVALTTPAFRLRSYGPGTGKGQPVLIVAAPIKRSSIWDLAPHASPVRLLADAGFAVHLLEWLDPAPSDADAGLDRFVERIGTAVDATGTAPVLLGHSLGGTLAALFCARYPQRAAGLALLEAPLHFGPDAGAFAPVVAASPHAGWLQEGFGLVPGAFLDLVTTAAAPREFLLERYVDFWTSGMQGRLRLHLQVVRWTLDECALPGRLVTEVAEELYRHDRFHRGELVIAGAPVGPATLTTPLLNIINPMQEAIPASAIVPFHEAAASPCKQLLEYRGEHGTALRHVGVLVGHAALTTIWPKIIDWAAER
jgi:polyhydroxyalkanoate synthase subunit PhaC